MLSERDNQYYENADGKKVFYSPHIIRAAEASRKYLKEMSYVTERGLEQLKKVVDLKYGRFDRTHADSIKEEINNAKKIIADGRKEEGYWPGLFMQNLVDIKTSMDTVMPTKSLPGLKKQMTQLQTVLQNLATVPDSAKKENPLLNTVWEKDPLFVLGQYGKDVVGFNKLVFSQEAYLKAYGRGNSGTDRTGVSAVIPTWLKRGDYIQIKGAWFGDTDYSAFWIERME